MSAAKRREGASNYRTLFVPSLVPRLSPRANEKWKGMGRARGGWTLHAPIHKGPNLGTGQRKLAGSSAMTYRS